MGDGITVLLAICGLGRAQEVLGTWVEEEIHL